MDVKLEKITQEEGFCRAHYSDTTRLIITASDAIKQAKANNFVILRAERDGMPETFLGWFKTMDDAYLFCNEQAEIYGWDEWLEGWDIVVTDRHGVQWALVMDCWEKVDG